MRGITFLTAVLVVLALTAGSARAQTWTWTGAGDGSDWSDPDNWNTPAVDANVPGIGEYAGDNILVNIAAGIDLKGIDVSVGQLAVQEKTGHKTFFSSIGSSTLSCTELFFRNLEGTNNNAYFGVDVNVSGTVWTNRKAFGMEFNRSLTAGAIELRQGGFLFNGPTTITQPAGLEVFYENQAIGGGPVYTFSDTLTTTGATGDVTIWSSDGTYPATLRANDPNTLRNVKGKVHVNAHGVLDLVVAQNALPRTEISAFGLLRGNVNGATYGDGNDIGIHNNAVVALTAGPEPTAADLGLVSGVKDAPAWQGVTADGTWACGDDGNSVYKGVAMGSFSSDFNGKRLVAPVGAEDLEVLWLGGAPTAKSANNMYMRSLDKTGVANITAIGLMHFKGGTINQYPDGNNVTTFNITNDRAASTTGMKLVDFSNDFIVQNGQTFNFSGMGYVRVDETNMKGHLSFSDGASLSLYGPLAGGDPNIHVAFGEEGILDVWDGDESDIEGLDFDTQITVSGSPILNFVRAGGTYVYDDANNPNLMEFMGQANISFRGTATMPEAGLVVGDGKTVLAYDGMTLQALGAGKIQSLGDADGRMGIAAAPGETMTITMPIDANGGTIVVNGTDELLFASMEGKRIRAIPTGTVELNGAISGAKEVLVRAGMVKLENDLVDNAVAGGLKIKIEDPARISFQQPADRTIAFDLSNTDISLEPGGYMYLENYWTETVILRDLTVKADYVNGSSGIRMNNAVCKIVVGGTLSGDGAWGNAGTVEVEGTVAPGDGVGELNKGGVGVKLADTAVYEWQISDPAGNAGTGWDLLWGDNIDFDVDDDDDGALTFRIVDAGLAADIAPDDTFVVAAAGSFDVPDVWAVSFEAPAGWDTSAAQLLPGGSQDVDGDGSDEQVYVLTGVGSARLLGTLAWSRGADGVWGEDAPGNWTLLDTWEGPGAEPNYPDDPYVAAVVDTPHVVTVRDANRQCLTADVSGGGKVAVAAGRTLTVTTDVDVASGGELEVSGTLVAQSLTTAGATTVHGGATLTVESVHVTGGTADLWQDLTAATFAVTGGTVDTHGNAVRATDSLIAAGAKMTTDASSVVASGADLAGAADVGIDAAGSTLTVADPAGGSVLAAPGVNFLVTEFATLHVDAATATLGDLSVGPGGFVTLSGAPDISFRDVGGVGGVEGSFSARGRIRPGDSIGTLTIAGSAALESGGALAPDVQGADTADLLVVSGALDLTDAGDAIAPSWVPGPNAGSRFGGRYLVVQTGSETSGVFDLSGGGNIGADYVADLEYNVDMGDGSKGIYLTLHPQLDADADLDGDVDYDDYVAARDAFAAGGPADWFGGDSDLDGDLDAHDCLALKTNFGLFVTGETVVGDGAKPVPEPAALSLLALGGLALMRRRRRRRRENGRHPPPMPGGPPHH